MLETTFQLLQGIDSRIEKRLWQSGIKTWQDLMSLNSHPHISKNHLKKLKKEITELQKALKEENYQFFLTNLGRNMVWRIFPNLNGKILYFDVEATGLDKETDTITTIATFDGKEVKTFVNGQNLEDFPAYVEKYPAIATFDGERLDIPLINKQLDFYFSHIHFDLFYLSRLLNVQGGLKKIERRIGVDRDPLIQEINGTFAIYLWKEFEETNNPEFLETLLAYNIEDVIHLEEMLTIFYNELRKKFGIPARRLRYDRKKIKNSKKIDSSSIDIIHSKYFS